MKSMRALRGRIATLFWAARYSPLLLARLINSGSFADREVLAYRSDGFGMRMGEILNAIRISAAFKAKFVFLWPTTDNDGIRPANQVFSEPFMRAHLRETVNLPDYQEVGTWTPEAVRALHHGAARGVWSISKRSLSPKKKFVLGADGIELPRMMTMREAFDAVGLVPELDDIRRQCSQLQVLDRVIHIRRGDIVGPESAGSLDGAQTHKAIPLALIDEMVRREEGSGRRVAVFGNGVDALGLRQRYPSVLLSEELLPVAAGRAELLDFRDFCLLTRAHEVVSAGSAFAMVPTLVGGGSRATVDDLFDMDTQRKLILRQLREEAMIPTEVVVSSAHLVRREMRVGAHDQAFAVLEAASAADETNPVFLLARASRLIESGKLERAIATLHAELPGPRADSLVRLARRRTSSAPLLAGLGGAFLGERHWSALSESAEKDPWIGFVVGLRALASGDGRTAQRLLTWAAAETGGSSAQLAKGLSDRAGRE